MTFAANSLGGTSLSDPPNLPIAVRNVANVTGSGNALDLNVPAGPFVDSWMCALSGRAKQLNLVEYFKDCE